MAESKSNAPDEAVGPKEGSAKEVAASTSGPSGPSGPSPKDAAKEAAGKESASQKEAPDPVVGIGLVILGVLVMGIGGAATLHYVFNVGTVLTIVGALVFLISVALSSLKERKLKLQ